MSDNPNDPPIILGADFDPAGFNAVIDSFGQIAKEAAATADTIGVAFRAEVEGAIAFNAALDDTIAVFQQYDEAIKSEQADIEATTAAWVDYNAAIANQDADILLREQADAFRALSDATAQATDTTQAEIDKINAEAEAFRAADDAFNQYLNDLVAGIAARNDANAVLAYGQPGGQIGPAQDTSSGDGSGDGSGGDTSGDPSLNLSALSSAGHALRSTGSPAGRDLGAALYIGSAIDKIIPLFDQLNTIILSTTENIGPLSGSLFGFQTALIEAEIPMAGIVSVAAPLIIVLGAVAAGLAIFNSEVAASEQALTEAENANKEYYLAIDTMTHDSIGKQLENYKEQQAAAESASKDAGAALKSVFDQLGLSSLGPQAEQAALAIDKLTGGGLNGLSDAATKDAKAASDLQAKVDGLTTAYNQQILSAEQLAAVNLQLANDAIKGENEAAAAELQRYQLLQSGSADSVQKVIDANNLKAKVDQDEFDRLTTYQATLQSGSDAYNAVGVELARLGGEMFNLNTITQDLTTNVLPAVTATEALKNSIKDIPKAVDDAIKQFDAIAKATDTLQAAEAKYADSTADRSAKEQQVRDDFATAQANKLTDHQTQLAQQDITFYEGEADKITKLYASVDDITAKAQETAAKDAAAFALQQAQNAQKLADDIAKINAGAYLTEREAAQNLDARAIERAELKRQADITNATNTYNQQKTIADQNEQAKIADLLKSAQEQHDQRLADGLATIQDEEANYQQKRQWAEDKFALDTQRAVDQQNLKEKRQAAADKKADEDQQAAFAKQQAAIDQQWKDMLGIQVAGQTNLTASNTAFWTGMGTTANTLVQGFLSQLASTTIPAPNYAAPNPRYRVQFH